MGQIVFNGQKPKYCNLTAITTGSKKDYLIPDGEIWLIDSTNTSKTDGTGKYDYYIKGDGSNTASQLAANKIKVDDSIDISGKAEKSEMSVVAGTGADADKTTITLKNGTSATVLTQHQDVSGKEDKSNKVTSFSSPTDTQYPSAKLVNDQLATKQGTISDLSTIRSGASAGATAYQKPGTGIPKTDLASAVQTSLGKADTAIQSVTVGTTTTGAAGTNASVTNTGTATEPVLSFTIPQGEQGVKGDTVIMGGESSYTLYNTTGDAVDGAMTQQAVTRELTKLEGEVTENFGSYVENPEFVRVVTDTEGRILYGVKTDGEFVFGVGVPQSIKDYVLSQKAEVDADVLAEETRATTAENALSTAISNEVARATGVENTKVNKEDGKSLIDAEYASSQSTMDNPEFLQVTTDSEGKTLAGRTPDGEAFENVGFSTPKVSIDGHTLENIEDPEGRSEITTDSEGKIISYRDDDGILHESVGIKTPSLTLIGAGINNLGKDLRNAGYGNVTDWSEEKELHIAEPYCAKINFTGIVNMPQAKNVDMQGYMEFWDMQGNYFKKEVIMNAQGNSTLYHPKKNIAIDICNNNGWDDNDTFNLQIGNWVSQDSFHLKAFYNDPFRCISPVAYKWFNEIVKSRGEFDDYIWKKALIDFSSITPTSNGSSTAKDTEAQYNTGARCFPDGFPCIVYLNGEFYGIFSWQLKKHRDNYHMNKKNAKHIHLDGLINDSVLFDGNIDWTSFEVRNPKDLIDMGNNKYDGDNPTELIDSTSPNYDSTNSKHVNTAKVKGYIENLAAMKTAVTAAYATYQASSKTAQDVANFKSVYETYFDPDNLIDYIIFSDVSNNYDGFNKNWQWLTYDGVKWYIAVYDCDGVFGGYFELNDTIVAPLTNHRSGLWMLNPIYNIYLSEMESRYANLRNDKIIDTNHIVGLVVDWLDRVGNKKVFEKEWEKWPQFIKNDSIHRLQKWIETSINNMDVLYHFN